MYARLAPYLGYLLLASIVAAPIAALLDHFLPEPWWDLAHTVLVWAAISMVLWLIGLLWLALGPHDPKPPSA